MTDTDKAAILAEIRDLAAIQEIGPTDVTLNDLKEGLGLSESRIRYQMDKLVKAGLYETFMGYDPRLQRQVRAWRKAPHSAVDCGG